MQTTIEKGSTGAKRSALERESERKESFLPPPFSLSFVHTHVSYITENLLNRSEKLEEASCEKREQFRPRESRLNSDTSNPSEEAYNATLDGVISLPSQPVADDECHPLHFVPLIGKYRDRAIGESLFSIIFAVCSSIRYFLLISALTED